MNGIQMTDYDIDVKVLRDSSGKIVSGMVVGDILAQNQALILQLHKGELKEDPSVGVGISDMLLDSDLQNWSREIREQMELDGQTVDRIILTNDELRIEARYR